MFVISKARVFVERTLSSAGGFYQAALYLCIGALFVLPVLGSVGITFSASYNLAIALVAFYLLHKMGNLPKFSTALKHDPLTGLLNREGFIDYLNHAISSAPTGENKPVVLVLDLRHFGRVNSSLGYGLGDKLLNLAAERIQKFLHEKDVLARINGDEYAIVLNAASIGYLTFCETLSAAFAEPFALAPDIETSIGFSAGAALYPQHGEDALTLLRSASIALRYSKKSRTLCEAYDATRMDSASADNLSLTSALKSAVDNNEFVFQFQPQLRLSNGKITGAEALIRWNHPIRGLVRPDEFIPLAEQSNQISRLTAWTIREGVNKLAKFREAGHDITLSINISPYALINSDIITALTKEIVYHSIPYKSLVVEITESSIDQSPKEMAKIIACLEMLGIHISIDDFGTGHASLLYLKHLPIKEIKIDRGFVGTMLSNASDSSIVKSTIELAHSLGCEVVAEGVETQEIMDKLRDLGCDLVQGYHIARPISEDDLLILMEQTNGRS